MSHLTGEKVKAQTVSEGHWGDGDLPVMKTPLLSVKGSSGLADQEAGAQRLAGPRGRGEERTFECSGQGRLSPLGSTLGTVRPSRHLTRRGRGTPPHREHGGPHLTRRTEHAQRDPGGGMRSRRMAGVWICIRCSPRGKPGAEGQSGGGGRPETSPGRALPSPLLTGEPGRPRDWVWVP